MKFNIHPNAIESFNEQALNLVDLVKATPRQSKVDASFETDIRSRFNITAKDIVGNPKEKLADYRGNIIGRYFESSGIRYALEDSEHELLAALAKKIQRLPAFRDRLSQKYIEENLFSWIELVHGSKGQPDSYFEFLIRDASSVVIPITVHVPIAYTAVEEPFVFCGVLIENLSKVYIDILEKEMIPRATDEDALRKFFEKLRNDHQGYASTKLTLECEYNYAEEKAIGMSQQAIDLLSIYSGAALLPDVKNLSRIKGAEHLATSTAIFHTAEDCTTTRDRIVDRASDMQWKISKQDLNNYRKCGLDVISELVIKSKRTDFESCLLNSITIYSKASLTAEPLEKLVYTLSALETALLKNENEPIQQNLGERIALFIGDELEQRKRIIRSVKNVYEIRSKYLHHGNSSSELDELTEFFRYVWTFFVVLLGCTKKYKSKAEFLDAINDKKLT